jgi:AraC-like DNA-binding protein
MEAGGQKAALSSCLTTLTSCRTMHSIPLDHPYIRACVLIGIDKLILSGQQDAKTLFQRAKIPFEAIDQPDSFISFFQVLQLVNEAALATNNSNFGLEWSLATPSHFPTMGPTVLLAKFARNLGDWLEMGQKYWELNTNGNMTELVQNDNFMTFRYITVPTAINTRHFTEWLLANIARMARNATNQTDLKATKILFSHSKPNNVDLHYEVFQCPLHFDTGRDEVIFDRDILSLPISGGMALFKSVLGLYVRHRAKQLPNIGRKTHHKVSMAISAMLSTRKCSLETISDAMGFSSPKKLQRMLENDQVTFSYVLDEVRRITALRLLSTSKISVQKIAHLLDYTSNAAFTLAFKRWHGDSPLQYRKKMRAGSSQ